MRLSKKQKALNEISDYLEDDFSELKFYLDWMIENCILEDCGRPKKNEEIDLDSLKLLMQSKKSLERIEELTAALKYRAGEK